MFTRRGHFGGWQLDSLIKIGNLLLDSFRVTLFTEEQKDRQSWGMKTSQPLESRHEIKLCTRYRTLSFPFPWWLRKQLWTLPDIMNYAQMLKETTKEIIVHVSVHSFTLNNPQRLCRLKFTSTQRGSIKYACPPPPPLFSPPHPAHQWLLTGFKIAIQSHPWRNLTSGFCYLRRRAGESAPGWLLAISH